MISEILSSSKLASSKLAQTVRELLEPANCPVIDLHTHRFPPEIDLCRPKDAIRPRLHESEAADGLLYHYVRRLAMTRYGVSQAELDSLDREKAADLIWQKLFIECESAPLDEGRMAFLTAMRNLNARDLNEFRQVLRGMSIPEREDTMFRLTGLTRIVSTNSPFNREELEFYKQRVEWDSRYDAAIRLDELLHRWDSHVVPVLKQEGFDVADSGSERSRESVWRFLDEVMTMLPRVRYAAVSFDSSFNPNNSPMLTGVVIPFCARYNLPLFLMPEVLRGARPEHREAGDASDGPTTVRWFQELAQRFPETDFWITPLNRSSQYDFHVLSCALPNVKTWGFWWFNLQPSIMLQDLPWRIEMSGTNFWPFNSDARWMWNTVGKWERWRPIFAQVLTGQFERLAVTTNVPVTRELIRNTIREFFDEQKLSR